MILTSSPLVGYVIQEVQSDALRVVYPIACAVAVIVVFIVSRIRLRGERELLKCERQPIVKLQPHGALAPVYECDPKETPEGCQNLWTVLRRDQLFRGYMI